MPFTDQELFDYIPFNLDKGIQSTLASSPVVSPSQTRKNIKICPVKKDLFPGQMSEVFIKEETDTDVAKRSGLMWLR